MSQKEATIHDMVDEYNELLPMATTISQVDAEMRATKFLVAVALLTNIKHALGDELIAATSVEKGVYAKIMNRDESKTVGQRDANVKAHPEYIAAREALEKVENDMDFIKTYQKIYDNAHIFYRQLARMETQ
jgi:hypothetical protein